MISKAAAISVYQMLHICLIMSSYVCYSAGFFGEHVAGGTEALDLERKFTLLAFNCKFLFFFCLDYPTVMHCATLRNAVVLFCDSPPPKKRRRNCMSAMRTDRLRKEVVRRNVALVPLFCDRKHFDGKTKKDRMTGVAGPGGVEGHRVAKLD